LIVEKHHLVAWFATMGFLAHGDTVDNTVS
jgi:hypothetical protein